MSLQELINKTSLEAEEKAELLSVLSKGDAAFQKEIAQMSEEHSDLLPYLYINLAAKKYAISKNDESAYRGIIENAKSIAEEFNKETAEKLV